MDPELVKAHIDITIGMLEQIQSDDADNSKYLKKLKDYGNLWQVMDQAVDEMTQTY
jgi:hypothetical protein